MALGLHAQVAIVTGGASGIGRCIAAAHFLASPEADFITGEAIEVKGGQGVF